VNQSFNTRVQLLQDCFKINFLSNNSSLARWFRRSLAASSLEHYLLASLEGDKLAKDYQRSMNKAIDFRKTIGFLFFKVYAATCESETFVII